MANEPATPAPPLSDPITKAQHTPAFVNIIAELDLNRDQLNKRQHTIREIETLLSSRYGSSNRMISYISRFGHPRASITATDIAAIETVLKSISGAQQINVLLHSPGGDGTIIEKMVDMCRTHLASNNRKLRIIVPNIAKSAATLFALGADEIIMGYCSELGPIDPQVPIVVSGFTQWISALAFVESRDALMQQIEEATKKKNPITGLLQQLGGLNIPFTHEMENQIAFAQKTAANFLKTYMLAPIITIQQAVQERRMRSLRSCYQSSYSLYMDILSMRRQPKTNWNWKSKFSPKTTNFGS
jgi:Serine dehydrogenase proteinase